MGLKRIAQEIEQLEIVHAQIRSEYDQLKRLTDEGAKVGLDLARAGVQAAFYFGLSGDSPILGSRDADRTAAKLGIAMGAIGVLGGIAADLYNSHKRAKVAAAIRAQPKSVLDKILRLESIVQGLSRQYGGVSSVSRLGDDCRLEAEECAYALMKSDEFRDCVNERLEQLRAIEKIGGSELFCQHAKKAIEQACEIAERDVSEQGLGDLVNALRSIPSVEGSQTEMRKRMQHELDGPNVDLLPLHYPQCTPAHFAAFCWLVMNASSRVSRKNLQQQRRLLVEELQVRDRSEANSALEMLYSRLPIRSHWIISGWTRWRCTHPIGRAYPMLTVGSLVFIGIGLELQREVVQSAWMDFWSSPGQVRSALDVAAKLTIKWLNYLIDAILLGLSWIAKIVS